MPRYSLLMLWLLLPGAAISAQQTIECPPALAPAALQLNPPIEGWHYFAESPLYLHGAAPLYGPPELRGHLVQNTVRTSKDAKTYVYQLGGHFPDGKWIQCAYGEHHALTLSKRLADDTSSCTITYRKGAKVNQHEIDIMCTQQ
jgi:hypothetical protein